MSLAEITDYQSFAASWRGVLIILSVSLRPDAQPLFAYKERFVVTFPGSRLPLALGPPSDRSRLVSLRE